MNSEIGTREIVTGVSVETMNRDSTTLIADYCKIGEENVPTIRGDYSHNKDDSEVTALYPLFRRLGTILGFLAQLTNLIATTILYYRWNAIGFVGIEAHPLSEQLLYAMIWLFTQTDLVLYIFMWVVLMTVLTTHGVKRVKRTYFRTNPSPRSIFVLGVQFYVGVVMGVFLSWISVDIVLGLPLPVFPMIVVCFLGLLISYSMILCYDLEDRNDHDDHDDESLEVLLLTESA